MKWNELPELPSRYFTYENSGRKENEAPPYSINKDGELFAWFITLTPIGWTRNPPFRPEYPCIAIMFEDDEFNRIWWHFNDPEYDYAANSKAIPNLIVPDDGLGD